VVRCQERLSALRLPRPEEQARRLRVVAPSRMQFLQAGRIDLIFAPG
jgi:hypothetical protein